MATLTTFTGVVLIAAGQDIQVHLLQTILTILGALAGIGGLLAGGVAIYKARSDRQLNNMQAMEILFTKQREVNVDLLKQREEQIQVLEEQLRGAQDNPRLALELRACRRERALLINQIHGLEATLAELHHRRGSELG